MDIKYSLKRLFAKKQKIFNPVSQQFLSLDREFLEKRLNLKNRAAEDGKKNIPKPDTAAKDAIAADIDLGLMEILRRGKNEFQDHVHAVCTLDAANPLDTQIAELKTVTWKALNDFYKACKDGINRLVSIKQDIADGELDYEKFRAENNLDRPADYPVSRLQVYLWIALAALIEGLLNAVALGIAHPEGPLGVGIMMIVIVLMNVAFGFAVGKWFWCLSRHINKVRRFFGWAASFALTLLAFVFNFYIGHYRDSLMELQVIGAGITDTADYYELYGSLFQTAANHAFSMDTFWKFGDIVSFLLMMVGIVMFFVFAYKFFTSDDLYPGYGNKARARDKNMTMYSNTFDDLQKELEEIGGKADADAKDVFKMGQASRDAVTDHRETLNLLASKYHAWVSELKAVGRALYATYRQINKEHRTDGSPPAFEIGFSIPDDLASLPPLPKSAKEQNVERLRKWRDACLTLVNDATNRYLRLYKTIAQLAPKNRKAERTGAYDIEVDEINAELKQEWENVCSALGKAGE